jgi:hypothetical protein
VPDVHARYPRKELGASLMMVADTEKQRVAAGRKRLAARPTDLYTDPTAYTNKQRVREQEVGSDMRYAHHSESERIKEVIGRQK